MSRSFNLSEWAIDNRPLVSFMMIVIMAAGMWSYLRLGRSEDPPFTFKAMIVQAQWPGATIDDTLQQLTDRLEKKLQETPNLDHIRSYTTPGQVTITVVLKDSTPPKAVPDSWYQVRKKIDDIRGTLPRGTVGPGFNDEFGDTFGIIYGFTADGFTHRELRDYVESVRSRLLRVKDVSKIETFGAQDERLYLEFSLQQLSGLGVDRAELVRALQAQNAVTPAGVVRTQDEAILLRVSGGFGSEADLRRVNFVFNGRLFRLTDLGTVRRTYADPPQPMFRVNGQPAIGLGISMREGGDVLALGRNVQQAMAEIVAKLPVGIEAHLVNDQPRVVDRAVGEFMKTLWEAIAIVMAVSLLTLGLRAGTVVACSIPLVLAVVFVAMDLAHINLQRVSLGALIIALGLLVDDAMITVESMVTKLEEGFDKAKAAIFAYENTHFPMGTGTLVTIVGFLPIGFAQSAAGEYTFSLFAVVGIALIVSWFVAAIFAPLIGMVLLSDQTAQRHDPAPGRIMQSFRRLLVAAMRRRRLTVGLTVALFLLSIVGARFVPQQFFPASDRTELVVDLKLPQNASIQATDRTAARLEDLLRGDADVARWSLYVGRGAVRFYLPLSVQLPNDFFAQAVVVATSLEARERVRARLERALPDQFPDVVGRIYALELGPPVGWPVQYRVSGPEPDAVRDIAFKLAQALGENRWLQKTNFDWIETAKTLQINVDQDQARLLGVSSETLAQALNTVISGVLVTQMRDGIYLIDVMARAGEQERVSLSSLRTLQIPLPNGRTAPLMQIASIGYGQEYPLIWRRDRQPTLTVQADVVPGVQPATAVKALAPKIQELSKDLPEGYQIAVGGAAEESRRSQLSVVAVLPLMLLLMLIILMVQLRSFQRLLMVLSVAPLGLIGVVAALLIAGKPLGFVALLGVIALIGMIVRNSVVLVVQIDAEIAAGRHPWNAVVEATTNRTRPILLTAAAAILGMIPIAPTVFWGPMAYAIMGGLAVATVLTLVFLPALYVLWFRVKEPAAIEQEVDFAAAPRLVRQAWQRMIPLLRRAGAVVQNFPLVPRFRSS
jgi:multidrug efflux pump subunit AcrB